KYHSDGKYIFWPNLAPAHYARDTINVLNDENIKFLNKADNPPNVPQLRPIELFWHHLKTKVYENDFSVKNIDHLKQRIRLKLEQFPPNGYRCDQCEISAVHSLNLQNECFWWLEAVVVIASIDSNTLCKLESVLIDTSLQKKSLFMEATIPVMNKLLHFCLTSFDFIFCWNNSSIRDGHSCLKIFVQVELPSTPTSNKRLMPFMTRFMCGIESTFSLSKLFSSYCTSSIFDLCER
ncbi:uncharacterized protein B4U79_08326, partial [Dinothrombium tinctorium]